jgi:hypothetical protein
MVEIKNDHDMDPGFESLV